MRRNNADIMNELIIYGYGEYGKIIEKVLMHNHIQIKAIVDNSLYIKRMTEFGNEIICHNDLYEYDREIPIIISLFNEEGNKQILEKLKLEGWVTFLDKDEYLDNYISQGIKETAYTFFDGENGIKVIADSTVACIITEKCSLRCKNCSHFIPQRNNPVHRDKDEIVREIKILSEMVENIREIAIYGGEALLHPDIFEICRELSSIKNIECLILLTNGTIMPSKDLFELWTTRRWKIQISDYGIYNKKADDIFEMCNRYGIQCEYVGTDSEWFKPDLSRKNRESTLNKSMYLICNSPKECPLVAEGKIWKCVPSYVSYKMGQIDENEMMHDTFDLFKNNGDIDGLRNFILDTDAPVSCDCCIYGEKTIVKKAEQIGE